MDVTGDQTIKIKDVYEIAERLEDKFDRRFEEIRSSFDTFRLQIERIDREGAIGTQAKLLENERQLEDLDKRVLVVEARPVVTREELHAVKGDIAALNLWQAGLTAVATWKKWQVSAALAVGALMAGTVGSVATIIWLHHG
jgi:hypothetical protein